MQAACPLDSRKSGVEVFACSLAGAAVQPHYGGLLECGGPWTQAARLSCTH